MHLLHIEAHDSAHTWNKPRRGHEEANDTQYHILRVDCCLCSTSEVRSSLTTSVIPLVLPKAQTHMNRETEKKCGLHTVFMFSSLSSFPVYSVLSLPIFVFSLFSAFSAAVSVFIYRGYVCPNPLCDLPPVSPRPVFPHMPKGVDWCPE